MADGRRQAGDCALPALYALLCTLSGEHIKYRGRWVAAGICPGKTDDKAWAYLGHLGAN